MYLDISMLMNTISFYLLSIDSSDLEKCDLSIVGHRQQHNNHQNFVTIWALWVAIRNNSSGPIRIWKYHKHRLVKEIILCLTQYRSSLAIDIDGCAKWQTGNVKSLFTILKVLVICHLSHF